MATSRIKGIAVEIDGDTTGLSKALSSVNKEMKSTQSQRKDVEKLLKLDPLFESEAFHEAVINAFVHRFWKAFHNRCYVKSSVMQSQFRIPRMSKEFGAFYFA